MIGPTGCGQNRDRPAAGQAGRSRPFLKIEASKFTEVGYVGRDVESMVRDLTELAVNMVKAEERDKVQAKAEEAVEERLLELLLPSSGGEARGGGGGRQVYPGKAPPCSGHGRLEDRFLDLEVSQRVTPVVEVFSSSGMEEMEFNFKEMLGNLFPVPHQAAPGQGRRSPGTPLSGRIQPTHRHGPGGGGGPAQGGAARHHFFR